MFGAVQQIKPCKLGQGLGARYSRIQMCCWLEDQVVQKASEVSLFDNCNVSLFALTIMPI